VGLLQNLLTWPVSGPLALTRFSMRQIERVAKTELTDDASVREELMLLHMALETGEIELEEHRVREAELMQRLREAREWRARFGMEEEWAPLEMPRASEDEPDAGGRDESAVPEHRSESSGAV
jgi:hypothetical protein